MYSAHSSPFDWKIAAQRRAAAKTALRNSDFPILTISSGSPLGRPRLAGWGAVDDRITTVTLAYGDAPEGDRWVAISTSRWAGTATGSGSLQGDLEHFLLQRGALFSDASFVAGRTRVKFEDSTVDAQLISAGDSWAARGEKGDLEVTVIAHGWSPDVVTVNRLTDVESLLAEPLGKPARPQWNDDLPVQPAEAPADGDPHRMLIDASLRQSEETAAWMKAGGSSPPPIPGLSQLWRVAVRRHMFLTDQPEPEARQVLTGVVSHLCSLGHSAEWFRRDLTLREQAISETLLFATGISTEVPSRRAQRAWNRDFAGTPTIDDNEALESNPEPMAWERAWADWASTHSHD